ncbi:MAG: hypothetical protein ACREQA_07575 [Candidatus Binatia bacterium]
MQKICAYYLIRLLSIPLFLALSLMGCAIEQRDEVIGGATVPIPRGMSKAKEQKAELIVPGFGGEQVAYRGSTDPEEIIEFYKKEMPLRGWRPNAAIVTRGGLLAYTKENKSVLITVSKSGSDTTLAVTVAGTRP